MSKLAFSGNENGSGIFTIAAPNSDTDRTLTLPDETGTVLSSGGAIDVNASAPADSISIDSSGNVGIGTSSPSSYGRLAVMTPTNNYGFLGVANSVGGGGGLNLATYYGTTKISYIDTTLEDGTPASEDSRITFATIAAGTLAERMRITNTGNVGIGTTSPSTALHVKSNWVSNEGQLAIDANSGQTYSGLTLQNNGVAKGYLYHNNSNNLIYLYGDTSQGLVFHTNQTERMRIDSSGRVTMPYQPSFKQAWGSRVYTGASRYLSTNDGDSVATGRDNYNIGSHFNSATGAFTAPVAGTYMFIFSVMRNGSNGSQLDVRFYKNNGNMWGRVYRNAYNNDYEYATMVTTTNMAANDYVQVRIEGNTSIYGDDTYFAGHLLG